MSARCVALCARMRACMRALRTGTRARREVRCGLQQVTLRISEKVVVARARQRPLERRSYNGDVIGARKPTTRRREISFDKSGIVNGGAKRGRGAASLEFGTRTGERRARAHRRVASMQSGGYYRAFTERLRIALHFHRER